jgi:hypothetical protein
MAHPNDGLFVWHDLVTRDVPAAIAFYSAVVGWKTEPFGKSGYQMWVGGQGPLGGVMVIDEQHARTGMRPHWMAHVQVPDVDATAKAAVARGGRLATEPTDIPTVGRFAVVADPQGASLSIFAPRQNDMPPHDPSKEGEFCWNELVTGDDAAAARFYTELLGWRILEEMDMGPMGKYRIFGLGDRRLGGMMRAPGPQQTPPAWGYYATVQGLEGAVARATGKGGKLLNGPMDVPGGRVAQLLDPQGAAFALHEAQRR